MPEGPLIAEVAALLDVPSSRVPELRLEPCTTGGNNRVYVALFRGRKLVVKQYFRHASDQRDRLRAEHAFLSYAAGAGISNVPRVITCDPERGIGIYEFIDGRKLAAAEINSARVREAGAFFLSLNDPACRAGARDLPPASEACFNIADHFAMVDGRIARFEMVAAEDETARAARQFIGELTARWEAVKSYIMRAAPGQTLMADVPERCVSPSDFGFHNAIVRPSGSMCFLDFEYAGWDDPAKMVGDFFSHPGVPVPREHFEDFVRLTMSFSRRATELGDRARLLLPVFQTKWCCIILNEFIPSSAERRRFADPGIDDETRKRAQLEKARALFDKIERSF